MLLQINENKLCKKMVDCSVMIKILKERFLEIF
jgi:hypothetical protein